MEKAKIFKHYKKNLINVMFGNHLFDKDDEFQLKLLEVIELFCRENMMILCRFFSDDQDKFANELKEMFGDEVTTLFARKKLFSKAKYYKRQVCLSEVTLKKVIALAMKYYASPEIEVSDKQGTILFEIGLNDNDGTFINFNTTRYNTNEVKTKINQILNQETN